MNTPTTLPPLAPNFPDAWEVRTLLHVLHRTERAFKVCAPFDGPRSAAGPSAWLPASQVHFTHHDPYVGSFAMKARVYRRLCAELAAARPAPAPT